MFSIDLECKPDAKDLTVAELWEAGSTGIIELEETHEAARLRAFFEDDEQASGLVGRFGGDVQPADCRDWVAFAREHLKPMEVGKRIFVLPEWRSDPVPDGRILIVINAGLAFGTGAHETTRLCLEAVERLVAPGCTFLDVGTGSGILAEAAYRLGAGHVYACDSDATAVVVARENFERARVSIPAFIGSADCLASGTADVIAANISPGWIADLAPEWARILKPGGRAILSGFEAQDVDGVSQALVGAGSQAAPIAITQIYGENSWRAIEISRG